MAEEPTTELTPEEALIEEVIRYSEARGRSPSSICLWATNNSRLIKNLRSRAEKTRLDSERLRAYMRANPPQDDAA